MRFLVYSVFMNTTKYCITFAGAVGSSKTPISNYLSTKLWLPIFNNDAIRSEVIEDFWFLNSDEHIKRLNARLDGILKNSVSFICDLSIDREWKSLKEMLINNNYQYFIISINLSKDLLSKLYKAKWYNESLEKIDTLLKDHESFLDTYKEDIWLNIYDTEFIDRLMISYNKTKDWINGLND